MFTNAKIVWLFWKLNEIIYVTQWLVHENVLFPPGWGLMQDFCTHVGEALGQGKVAQIHWCLGTSKTCSV